LSGSGKVCNGFASFLVVGQGANWNQQRHVVASLAGTIRTFSVAAAIGLEFAVVAVAQKRVVVGIGFEIDASSPAAIAPGRTAAWNIFFAAERDTAVAAVAGFYIDFASSTNIAKNPIRKCV